MTLSTIACNFNPEFNNGLPIAPDGHKTGINDPFINSSGNFVILQGMAAVRQAIRQFMQLWLGEWFFNGAVGVDYNSYLSSPINDGVNNLENRIRELFQPFSGVTNQWQCNQNWNAYLNFNHSVEDYNLFQAKVVAINPTYDKENGIEMLETVLQFGNGQTENIQLQLSSNNMVIDNVLSVTEKMKISNDGFVANQPTIATQIIFPDNWIIKAGELIVKLKVGGLYSNPVDIICTEYINRMLILPLQLSTISDDTMPTDWKYLSKFITVTNVY